MIPIAPLFHHRVLQEHRAKFAFPIDLTDRYHQFLPLLEEFRQTTETLVYLQLIHSLFCGVLGYISPFEGTELWEIDLTDRIYLGYFTPQGSQPKIQIVTGLEPFKINFDQGMDWLIVIDLDRISLYYKDYGNLFSQSFSFNDCRNREELELFYSIFCRRNLLGNIAQPSSTRAEQLLEMTKSIEGKLGRDFYNYVFSLKQKLQRDISYRLHHLSINEEGLDDRLTKLIIYRLVLIQGLTDRGLLPSNLLQDAYNFVNPYVIQPVWVNFRAVFRWLKQGNPQQGIPPLDIEFVKTNDILDRVIHIGDELCRQMKEIAQFNLKDDIYPVFLSFLLINLLAQKKINFKRWRSHKLIQQAISTWNYLAENFTTEPIGYFDPECGMGLRLLVVFRFLQTFAHLMTFPETPTDGRLITLIQGNDPDEQKIPIVKLMFYLSANVKIELGMNDKPSSSVRYIGE